MAQRETRFSLMGTSLFWGAGVTLRFLLVIWVPVALGITSNAMPTYLNAMVAVGIVLGAGAAAKLVTGDGVALYAGRDFDRYRGDSLCGAAVAAAGVRSAAAARGVRRVLYRTAERAAAGAWETSVGAGNAIAVQNLGENVAMLLMLGLYSTAVSVGVPPVAVGIGFGAVFAVAIAALWVWGRRK